jgi:hypothetical protein
MKPLSRDEFAAALKKGQGRALQHIIHFGMGEYRDLVLKACLHNQNFDAQSDSCRAPWLFSMFRDTSFYEEFQEAIFNNLEISSSWDLMQLCDFLREMAEVGDTLAKQRLKETVFKLANEGSEDENIIIEEFVDLQSTGEFIELARILGERLLNDQEAFPFEYLIPEEKEQQFKEILYRNAQEDPSIRKYWEYLDERGRLKDKTTTIKQDSALNDSVDQKRKLYNVDQILENARNKKGQIPGRYAGFGTRATKEELKTVYASLIEEADLEVQKRLLWVFRRAPLPELNDSLFQWANGADEGLSEAVIAALAQIQDEKVHKLGREKVKRAELLGPDRETIGLFQKNYDKADAGLITSALFSVEPDELDAHVLGYDLIELSEKVVDPGLSDTLKWVYEYTPCMFCRYKALIQLMRFDAIDERITQELPYDANEDIRALAGK